MKTSITVDEVNQWQYSNELNPLYLNYICTLNGHYPVQIEHGFNYCELGCGVGITLNGLAELFPKGKFFGIDNNIDYIDECPLGVGALAGTSYKIDRNFTSK